MTEKSVFRLFTSSSRIEIQMTKTADRWISVLEIGALVF
jgi:hypothetical protein